MKPDYQQSTNIEASKTSKQLRGMTSALRGQLITVISAVSAIWNQIPPMLVFHIMFYKYSMMKVAHKDAIGTKNPIDSSADAILLHFKIFFSFTSNRLRTKRFST